MTPVRPVRWLGLAAVTAPLLLGCGLDPFPCPAERCPYAPTAPVDLIRDTAGVTHVRARTDDDAYYGAGYAQARDHLFQMDLVRRRAYGRRAEILGADAADDDALVRIVGIPQLGREAAAATKSKAPARHRHAEAWAAGVNAYIDAIARGEQPLPHAFAELGFEPEPWTADDAFVVGKLVLFGNANQIEFEILATALRDFFPAVWEAMPLYAPLSPAFVVPPEERPVAGATKAGAVVMPAPSDAYPALPADAGERLVTFARRLRSLRPGASNNWAIAGRHSADGRPLIAGDPHQALRSPSIMWMHHMQSDEGLDVIGFNFVGSPTVQLGHNARLVWTATTSYPDVMDLVDVRREGDQIEIDGSLFPLTLHEERITVRDGDEQVIEVETAEGYGVLLPADLSPVPLVPEDHALLLRWTGYEPTSEAISFMEIDAASSLEAFEDAVGKMEIGNFNFIAATAEGITYRSPQAVPARSTAHQPFALVPGEAASEIWGVGNLVDARLPQSRGGQRGWLASANNDPFGFTSDSSLVGDAYYFGVFFDPGTRAARIENELERLVSRGDIDLADMRDLQLDSYTLLADVLVPLLAEAMANVGSDTALDRFADRPELVALAEAIAGWDRRMTTDSGPALAFHAFMWFAAQRAIRDDLTLLFDAVAEAQPIFVLKWALQTLDRRYPAADALMEPDGRDVILLSALADAHAFLESRFGSADPSAYSWGDFHVTTFKSLYGDALDGGAVATDGSDGTVNVGAGRFLNGEEVVDRVESGGGSIYRMVAGFDADGTPRAEFQFARGLSGDPTSPHWDDLHGDWSSGVYRPLWFRDEDVDANAEDVLQLMP